MSRFAIIGLAFMLLSCSLTSSAEQAQRYRYVSYSPFVIEDWPSESISIDGQKNAIYVGHAGRAMHLCSQEDQFLCFRSSVLQFAVPKQEIRLGQTWSKEDRAYKVLRDQTIELLGRRVQVHLIASQVEPGRTDYFYYSDHDGLIGFALIFDDQKSSRLYFSTSRIGFFAKEARKQQRKQQGTDHGF